MTKIHPLVLCGGMGSRLWPMSRQHQPKQFQPTNGPGTLTYFQTTVQRHRGPIYEDPIVVTNLRHADLASQQLAEIQSAGLVIAEPFGRNTGPAVLAAAMTILSRDPAGLLLVLPADHMILGDLNTTISAMRSAARAGRIVTFGITPGYAETGFGYIIDGGADAGHPGLRSVSRFVEKPDFSTATDLIASGTAYWASGISLFRADVICAEFARLDPATFKAVQQALLLSRPRSNGMLLDQVAFAMATDNPTERAVFERSTAVSMAPISVKWDDVGAWAAVYDVNHKSADGNVTSGDVLAVDTTNSLIRSDGRLVVVVGMQDMIVVDTKDALLVTDRAHAQQVKQVVDTLKANGRDEVVTHPYHTKPWGGVEALLQDASYKLEMLTLRPGSTMQINGHGLGDSFLSVVTGEGSYSEDATPLNRPLSLGAMLAINRNTEISLTNTQATDLQALLLSITAAPRSGFGALQASPE